MPSHALTAYNTPLPRPHNTTASLKAGAVSLAYTFEWKIIIGKFGKLKNTLKCQINWYFQQIYNIFFVSISRLILFLAELVISIINKLYKNIFSFLCFFLE